MSRTTRVDPEDCWHHVTNHAVAFEDLFLTDRDRYEFLRRMFEAADKHGVRIVAYCMMGNHFHLVLNCPTAGLSAFMHYLESVYAREFNMRHARRGPLFAGEFHNELILDDGQAIATIRYVHRNALELGIDIRTYPWSSHPAYVSGEDPLGALDMSLVQVLFGSPVGFREYVEADFDSDRLTMAMGVRRVYRSPPATVEASVTELCTVASRIWATERNEVVAPRRGVRNDARLAVALVANESKVGFADELRTLLGHRSASSLRTTATRARARLNTDPTFARPVHELRTRWTNGDSIAS